MAAGREGAAEGAGALFDAGAAAEDLGWGAYSSSSSYGSSANLASDPYLSGTEARPPLFPAHPLGHMVIDPGHHHTVASEHGALLLARAANVTHTVIVVVIVAVILVHVICGKVFSKWRAHVSIHDSKLCLISSTAESNPRRGPRHTPSRSMLRTFLWRDMVAAGLGYPEPEKLCSVALSLASPPREQFGNYGAAFIPERIAHARTPLRDQPPRNRHDALRVRGTFPALATELSQSLFSICSTAAKGHAATLLISICPNSFCGPWMSRGPHSCCFVEVRHISACR